LRRFAQRLVVSPQRQRIPILLRRRTIHQLQRPILRVVIELFQNPRFHLRAAIGECGFYKDRLDNGFSFRRSLLACYSAPLLAETPLAAGAVAPAVEGVAPACSGKDGKDEDEDAGEEEDCFSAPAGACGRYFFSSG